MVMETNVLERLRVNAKLRYEQLKTELQKEDERHLSIEKDILKEMMNLKNEMEAIGLDYDSISET